MSLIRRNKRKTVRESLSVGWRQLEPDRPGLNWWQQILIVILLGVIIWLAWWLFYSPRFQVSLVTVEGVSRLDPAAIKQQAKIEGSNIFRVRSDDVAKRLASQSEIANVVLVRVLPSTIKLVVTERAPVLLWKTTDNWYLVDQRGIAFRQINSDRLEAEYGYLPHVLDVANIQVNTNDPVVPRSFIAAFQKIHEIVPQIFPNEEDYYEVTETVYDLDAVLKNGKRIRFNILTNVSQQLAALGELKQKRSDLINHSYLDLRVERWAYLR